MEPVKKGLHCQVCGRKIPPGGVFYIGRTEIISGSDGILADTGESGDRIIERALADLAGITKEQELMAEVYQEIKLILCGQCRLTYRQKILDMIKY